MNRHLLYLAMRYLMHHRRRTFLLWLGLSITCLLPLSVHHLTKMFEAKFRLSQAVWPPEPGPPSIAQRLS